MHYRFGVSLFVGSSCVLLWRVFVVVVCGLLFVACCDWRCCCIVRFFLLVVLVVVFLFVRCRGSLLFSV